MRNWRFWRLIAWGICMFIVFIMPVKGVKAPSIPHLDKLVHFGLFLFLSAFAMSWLKNIQKSNLYIALLIVFSLGFYGIAIEWLQGRFFGRSADFWDWVADVVGVVAGIVLYGILHRLRKYIQRKISPKN